MTCYAFSKFDQSEQQVFRSDVVVVKPLSLLARKRQSLLGTWSKIIHCCASDATARCMTMLKIGMTHVLQDASLGGGRSRQDNNRYHHRESNTMTRITPINTADP